MREGDGSFHDAFQHYKKNNFYVQRANGRPLYNERETFPSGGRNIAKCTRAPDKSVAKRRPVP